ncbi:MAG: exonuclease domain-containing protein [Bacilli bacterium]
MDYIAFDFETANQYPTSACSIGLVGVTNNKIDFAVSYLINPEESFSDFNINIHHITEAMVANAECFPAVWEKIRPYFTNTIVFAHNVAFDIGVLKALIEKYNLEKPQIKFGCTWKIAAKLWKDELKNHRLNTLSAYLEVEHQHHDALSDAKVCVEIIKRGQKMTSSSDVYELYDALGIRFGRYDAEQFLPTIYKYTRKKPQKIIKNNLLNDKIICVLGKPKSLTKAQLTDLLQNQGVFIEKNINRSLDYVLVLGNCPKAKLMVAAMLASQGATLKFINEDELLAMIKEEPCAN